MRLKPFYVFYVLILFIVSACKPSGYTSSVACDDFPEVEILTKDSVKINEILIPVWMSVCDDKAVVHSMKTDDVFFVYGLPESNFLYKAGVRVKDRTVSGSSEKYSRQMGTEREYR